MVGRVDTSPGATAEIKRSQKWAESLFDGHKPHQHQERAAGVGAESKQVDF